MAMPEQFSLRWNDFHSNLSQSFHALLEGEDLVDVTLAAGGQYVHAHKLILSVCSPYFKELFKVLAALHFFADGSYQAPVGEDSLISLSQPSISRAIEVVTNAIVDVLAPLYIRFPVTSEEKRKTMAEFQGLYNIPNVLGAVDGTHVAIFKPPNNHPTAPGVIFFNRKGFYSINCQVTNPCEHPIVILKDVAHQELKQLLQFMYRGEVHVRQQELSGFLHTAELLQVKGLTSGRERSESPPLAPKVEEPRPVSQQEQSSDSQAEWIPGGEDTIATESPPETDPLPAPVVQDARSPLKRLLKNTPNKNNYSTKKKPRPANDSPTHAENSEYAYDSEPLIDFDNDLYHSVLVLPDSAKETGWNCKSGGVKCPSCHRFFANRYNLKVHIRDKHDTREGTLQCEICQKRMRNPSCLRVHMYHHRKQAAYLAQLTTQGEQMRHVVQNIVGGKWRADAPAASAEYDNFPSPTPGPPAEGGKCPLSDPAFPGPPEANTPRGEADVEKA